MEKDYYFIRVGSDSGGDIPYSMIIDDRFLFIPIEDEPKAKEGTEVIRYSYQKLSSFNSYHNLIKYFGKVCTKKDELYFHLDPFFNFDSSNEFSYGDRTINEDGKSIPKAKALKNLKDDKKEKYIFFLATIVKPTGEELKQFENSTYDSVRKKQELIDKGLALIGYFKVKEVQIFKKCDSKNINKKKYIRKTFRNNAHIKRGDIDDRFSKYPEQELIFVLGDPKDSKFLDKPIILSDSTNGGHYALKDEIKRDYFKNKTKAFGYRAYKFFDKSTLDKDKLLNEIKNRA